MLPFYTPGRHQGTFGFLVVSEGFKWNHWPQMRYVRQHSLALKLHTTAIEQ